MQQKSRDMNDYEMYFTWYMEELIQHGYLKSYQWEPEKIIILPDYVHKREKHYKVRPNELENFTLLPKATYTYDFRMIWNESAIDIFTNLFDKKSHFPFGIPTFVSHYVKINDELEIASYVDIKPHSTAAAFSGSMASYFTFPFVQKILLATRGLYINKIVPIPSGKKGIANCLFNKTFTPNRYKMTDGGGQKRTIKFPTTPIVSYAKRQRGIIDDLRSKSSQQTLL